MIPKMKNCFTSAGGSHRDTKLITFPRQIVVTLIAYNTLIVELN